jgi:hypothetical protein
MNQAKQRIAIAEACGWKMHDHPDCLAKKEGWVSRGWETWVMNPSGLLVFKHDIPNYLNDLNAMHKAENLVLRSAQQRRDYADALDDGNGGHFATSAQRAEAFLRTIGKWEES